MARTATKKKPEPKPRYQCSSMISEPCINENGARLEYNFYKGSGREHSHFSLVHVCKDCLYDLIGYDPKTMEMSINQLINALIILNKPFINKVWESALKEDRERLGTYLKNLSFHIGKGSQDVTFTDGEIKIMTVYDELENSDLSTDIKITDEMMHRWGKTRDAEDIKWLERYYQKMKEANNIVYPQHLRQLESICNLSLDIKQIENSGKLAVQSKNYKALNDSLNSILSSSGLRPIDKKAGQGDGITTFSQTFEFVEKNGAVPPVKVDVPRDIIDKELLILLNGYRDVNNKQRITSLNIDIDEFEEIGFDDLFGDDDVELS